MVHYINTFPGREIILDGKKYLYFGGTSYLGLQTDAAFQKLFIENVKRYGTNYGASRKSNVQISVFDQAEQHLAKLVGSEACTSLSSGYLAGQLVVQTLNSPPNQLLYAPNTHSALYLSHAKPYYSFKDLNTAVREHLTSKNGVTPIVCIDSIDFSGTNYPDFKELQSLPLEELILVVDDSHGIGIVGAKGGGVYKKLKKLNPKELIICCSLGKGFGIQAGAIFGTKRRIEQLTNTDFFGGASPASPASIATLLDGSAIFENKRVLLEKNIQLFLGTLKKSDLFKFIYHHPTFSFLDPKLVAYLKTNRIIVTNFQYPNEDSALMSRIVLSAAHANEDIKRLTSLINSY